MRIPFCESYIEPNLPQVVAEQVASGWWGPGHLGEQFVEALTKRIYAKYGVLTVSGTVALTLAAKALIHVRQGYGDILVPAYGVISVPNALCSANADIMLVDIDKATGCMSPKALEEVLWTAPVCFVDFSGYRGPDLETVHEMCKAENILLIEDAACTFPSPVRLGDIITYSFSMPKWITTGQGGAVFTDDEDLFRHVAGQVDHGGGDWRASNFNEHIGSNLRMTDIQAVMGLRQLDEILNRWRMKCLAHIILRERLGDKLFSIPNSPPLHNILFAPRRDALIGKLNEQGIEARWQYRTISQHPCYKHLAGHYPNADWWTDHAVYLPFGMALTPEQAEVIADAVIASGEKLVENHD